MHFIQYKEGDASETRGVRYPKAESYIWLANQCMRFALCRNIRLMMHSEHNPRGFNHMLLRLESVPVSVPAISEHCSSWFHWLRFQSESQNMWACTVSVHGLQHFSCVCDANEKRNKEMAKYSARTSMELNTLKRFFVIVSICHIYFLDMSVFLCSVTSCSPAST